MLFRRSTKEFELEDELLACVNESSPYRVQTEYIMDEPVIKQASAALPVQPLMTRTCCQLVLAPRLAAGAGPPLAIWKERESDKMLLYSEKQFMTTV